MSPSPSCYLYFPGCKIGPELPEYDRSVRAVMDRLGVRLTHVALNCCGYPIRHQDLTASLVSAARILAVADAHGLGIMTPCKCCFGNLKHADYWLQQRPDLARQVADILRTEGLKWRPKVTIEHLLTVLSRIPVTEAVTRPLTGLAVAAHYGCHALRPSAVTGFDNPLAPTRFESLITAIGASPVTWSLRLECCGQPLHGKNQRLAQDLRARKLADAQAAGADILATACTYCQLHFDADPAAAPRSVLYTHLIGLALGLSPDDLCLKPQSLVPWR